MTDSLISLSKSVIKVLMLLINLYKSSKSNSVFSPSIPYAVFKYTEGDHNVFKVNGTVFKDCTIPPPNGALTSGNDVITLMTPGKKWYICGIGNHCAEHNQKLAITVMDGTAPAPAPETDSAHGILTSGYQIFLAAAGIFVAMIVA